MDADVRPSLATVRTARSTVASMCKVSGKGLEMAIARQPASFTIEAIDTGGERATQGGELFRVDVRGSSVVRARVVDHEDGTYTCKYVPSTSGQYSISISLHGVALNGSPHSVSVLMPRPDPPQCVVKGEALRHAIAHAPTAFELSFVDALGQTTFAEELDVYVEPLEPFDDGTDRLELLARQCERAGTLIDEDAGRTALGPAGGGTAAAAPAAAPSAAPAAGESANKAAKNGQPTAAKEGKEGKEEKKEGKKPRTDRVTKDDAAESAPPAADAPAALAVGAVPSVPIGTVWRLAVGPKPLLVRADCSLQSEQVGTVLAGKLVKVLEAIRTDDGLRCRIVLPSNDVDEVVPWLDGLNTLRDGLGGVGGVGGGLGGSQVSSARMGSARSEVGPFSDPFHVCNSLVEASSLPLSTHEQVTCY